VKKVKGGISTRQAHQTRQEKPQRQWTGGAPYADTDYPFEPALVTESDEEHSCLTHHGEGLRLYASTCSLCRPDTLDSMLLTICGEQFREFYPGELPWREQTAHSLCEAMWGQEEAAVVDSLRYLATQGFLDLDTSVPDVYRYRLNVDAVRQAKNRYFRPMSETERIADLFQRHFPDYQAVRQAFVQICDQDDLAADLLKDLWDRSLERLSWTPGKRPEWIAHTDFLYQEQERYQEAMQWLVQKGFLERRATRWTQYEYRPNVSSIWEVVSVKLLDSLSGATPASRRGA
jgi:hypothetical protein